VTARGARFFSCGRGVARPSRRVSLKLVLGLSILCSAQRAVAERSIVAEVPAVAPFDAAELAAALRVRLPRDGAPVVVRVAVTRDGVVIEARGNVRAIALRDLTGAAAARFVALAAHDLLLDDLAELPSGAAPVRPVGAVARSSEAFDTPTVGVLGAAAAWQHVLGGVAIDLAIPRGAWLLAIEGGGGTLVDGRVDLTAATIRISGGVRASWVELRSGATLAPLFVSSGAGDRTILAGLGASVRVRARIASGISAVLAGGADVFATRTTYLFGDAMLETPRVAPWVAAGVEMAP
jgi:hypothetical protein